MGTLLTWSEFAIDVAPKAQGSIPENLMDFIENVSPVDRPVLSMLGKTKVNSTRVEWLQDSLASRGHNAWVESVSSTNPDLTTPSRTFADVQTFMKFGEVSDIQRAIEHKGFSDAYLYQESKKLNELTNDIEHALCRGSAATGGTAAARQLAGLLNIFSTNWTSSSGTTLTEDIFVDRLQAFYDNNVDVKPSACLVNSWLKRTISQFSTKVTRNIDAAAKVQVNVIERHQSDFGDILVYLSRDQLKSATRITQGNSIVFIDPSYFLTGWLQPVMVETLARTGTQSRFMIAGSLTLLYRTEKAGGGGVGFVPYLT